MQLPHGAAAIGSALPHASRACRMAARESPGGELSDSPTAVPTGVAGTVSNAEPPKRQCRPARAEHSDELSSDADALPCPASAVSSRSSMNNTFCTRLRGVEGQAATSENRDEEVAELRCIRNSASALSSAAPCLAFNSNASRASRLFAERNAGGVIGTPEASLAIAVATHVVESFCASPHDVTASRAWRIDARESPGGERVLPSSALASAFNFATVGGVAGTVSNGVLPKRHRLPETEVDTFG